MGQALILGVVQGFTEFLPISSSGHLVILQHYFGLTESMISFDVLVHVGTLAAVVVFLRKNLLAILLSICRRSAWRDPTYSQEHHVLLLILVALIPTALVGIVIFAIRETLFRNLLVPATMLIVTGWLLWLAGRCTLNAGQSNAPRFGARQALLIGLAQGIAIIPGISRSGATISAALLQGVKREVAFRFSFLLFIPAVIAALVMEARDMTASNSISMTTCTVAVTASFVTGILALFLLERVLRKGKLACFAWYCWALGGVIIVSQVMKALL